MKMNNSVSKIIEICEELVWRKSSYSCSPLKVDSSNRIWKES